MADTFILDTCVLSEASRTKPHPVVRIFLDSNIEFCIPAAVLMEIQLGIMEICGTNPSKAVQLSNWYQTLMAAGIPIIPTDKEVAELWGTLAADPRLRNLIIGSPNAKKARNGQDLHIAAVSLIYRIPIATYNVKDFMLIDALYPLPGIYDPREAKWHAKLERLVPDERQLVNFR